MQIDFARLEAIFVEAVTKANAAGRSVFLDQACGDDAELRSRVEALLAAHHAAGSFLKLPAEEEQAVAQSSPLSEGPGTVIGPYKLLQQIGEGGFGVVFMAEQRRPVKRSVALKIIKPGMDSREVIGRFEAERQAMAMMDHPNIAKVYDAGATESGRPYFVMELVQGVPITEYCDRCNLTTRERLELFVTVCQAVQHAHQKGIIHRDIKPTNVLVAIQDGRPAPNIIDFGVAKAISQRLTEHTLMTAFAQMVGTPLYMSPEQAELSPLGVDTRSDIYSLGVLLYELLTGTTPFDKNRLHAAAYDEFRRIIREEEPPRPSARISTLAADLATTIAERRRTDARHLLQTVRGELDWIVMKCLEKDRNRRYETPSSLARDVECHLHDEPVQACPPSISYRIKKFIRRNRVGVVAGSAIVATLIIGLTLSSMGFLQARRQARVARTEATRSEQVSQFLKDMLAAAGPSIARGRDASLLREILDKTAQRVGKDLDDQPLVAAELRNALGEVYRALGEYAKAETMHRGALALRRQWLGPEHPDVATSLDNLADALCMQGGDKRAEAVTLGRESLDMRMNLLGNDHPDVALSLNHLARELLQLDQSDMLEVESLYRADLELRRKLYGREHPLVAVSLSDLSNALRLSGHNLPEAEELNREALAMLRKLLGDEHPDVADTLGNLSNTLRAQGKLAEAETTRRENLAMRRNILGNEHPAVADSLGFLAGVLQDQGKLAESEDVLREALGIRIKSLGREHQKTTQTRKQLIDVLQREGKLDEAEIVRLEAAPRIERNASVQP